jgi:hypothetical protein
VWLGGRVLVRQQLAVGRHAAHAQTEPVGIAELVDELLNLAVLLLEEEGLPVSAASLHLELAQRGAQPEARRRLGGRRLRPVVEFGNNDNVADGDDKVVDDRVHKALQITLLVGRPGTATTGEQPTSLWHTNAVLGHRSSSSSFSFFRASASARS